MPQPERMLITGGSGFLGACLARELIEDGHDVHLVLRAEAKRWRLAGLEGRFTEHRADLRDLARVQQAVRGCRPEVIYHLAAHGAYPSQTSRAVIVATNLVGTANLLEALEGQDYRALVYTGSSSEYGHKTGPMREDDRLEPRTDYAVAKAAATHLCLAEAYKGRPVSVVRVFSAYGPWEEPTRLVPYVMDCCFRGINPKVTAGRQPRDFIYVEDVTALLRRAAALPAARGQILHAGTRVHHTVRDMIETIVTVCGQGRVQPEYGTELPRPDEPADWVADIDKTVDLTSWQPWHSLETGVASMWNWFQQSAMAQAA